MTKKYEQDTNYTCLNYSEWGKKNCPNRLWSRIKNTKYYWTKKGCAK